MTQLVVSTSLPTITGSNSSPSSSSSSITNSAASSFQAGPQPVDLVRLLIEKPALVLAICDAAKLEEYEDLSRSLLLIFEINKEELTLIKTVLKKEITSTSVGTTLFRENSIATTMMSTFCKQLGTVYLKHVLGPIIEEIFASGVCLELDPNKASPEEIKLSQDQLLHLSKRLLRLVYKSERVFPIPLKAVFSYIQKKIGSKFPAMKYQVIGGFYFLRFMCPALVSPERYHLITITRDMEIPLQARRSLVLLSKVLQALASQVAFGEKEGYMLGLNKFLEENQQKVCLLLDKFSTNTVRSASFRSFVPSEEDKQRAFTSVMNILIGRRAQVREALAKEQQEALFETVVQVVNSIPQSRPGMVNLYVYRTSNQDGKPRRPGIMRTGSMKTSSDGVPLPSSPTSSPSTSHISASSTYPPPSSGSGIKRISWKSDSSDDNRPDYSERDGVILLLKELLLDEQQMKRRLKSELEDTKSKLEAEIELRIRLENMLAVLNDNIDREVENRVEKKLRSKRRTHQK